MMQPLSGRTALVAASEGRVETVARSLRELGATVIPFPTVRIEPAADSKALDDAVRGWAAYDWAVFTSTNGVEAVVSRARALGVKLVSRPPRIAVVGPATMAAAEAAGLPVDAMPKEFLTDRIADALGPVRSLHVLLARSDLARKSLANRLRRKGAQVDVVDAYRTVSRAPSVSVIRGVSKIDLIVFTSASAVHNLVAALPSDLARSLRGSAEAVCIGPVTATAARGHGFRVAVTAREHSVAGLVRELREGNLHGRTPPLTKRPRRLRRTAVIRDLVREVRWDVGQLIQPMFVRENERIAATVPSMPGLRRFTIDEAVEEAKSLADLGLKAILLFGLPSMKDDAGTEAYADHGVVQTAIRAIKVDVPDLVAIADVCLCEYTDHGHCGVVVDGRVDNDASLVLLSRAAVSLARAGADVVGPSAMMDGQVRAIRTALDSVGFQDTIIMAYSAKHASAFYGPFRDAADSAPRFGDRRGYQMDPANVREALREIALDVEEGADLVMVKPALPYLDVIRAARERFDVPLAAYSVSGEYAMVKAAANLGWLDEHAVVAEILTAIRRAGADLTITYHAKDVAEWERRRAHG